MKPMHLRELAQLMGISTDSQVLAHGVAADSRLVRSGDVFFALPGAKTDGHAHLSDAAAKGAVAAVVHNDYAGNDMRLPLLRTNDVLKALQDLAKTFLGRSKARVVAITGSLGKTTTKEFTAALLRKKYHVYASPGNSNSQIGLPLSIINHATLDEDILVIEMGMTLPGQIKKLVEIAPPTVAVVTTVALVHAGNFDSLEEIAKAKGEIFSHPATEYGFYDKESDLNHALTGQGTCQKFSFSITSPVADTYLEMEEGSMVVVQNGEKSPKLPILALPGEHNKHNFLCAVTVARHFGLSWEDIREVQKSLFLPDRRLEHVQKFGALFVNDSYNAAEMSTKSAISSLPKPQDGGRRIVVFGGMPELGKFSVQCHRNVAEFALQHVDYMYCFGDECLEILRCWEEAKRPVVWAKERIEIAAALRKQLRPGDVVLLKGMRIRDVGKILDELDQVSQV
jgi:UDP-N-acetylmuramoyl-tripeptide--D-alanyl-D-alanine ligase